MVRSVELQAITEKRNGRGGSVCVKARSSTQSEERDGPSFIGTTNCHEEVQLKK